MKTGWVKNYRSLLDWEWYHDLPTRVLFQHLLLIVNWEDKNWQGQKIKKGEIITSIDHLKKGSDLSAMQVRRALQNLQSTGEIKVESTNRYTKIKINNYGRYQTNNKQTTNKNGNSQQTNNKQEKAYNTDKHYDTEKDKADHNKQTTNKQQTKTANRNKQTTTTKEYKNIRNKEDNIYVVIDNKKYRRDDPNRPLTLEERKDLGLA